MDKSRDQHEPRAREFDEVFQHVNSISRYQCLVYNGMNMLCAVPMVLHWNNIVFAMGTPHFRCDDVNTTCSPNECCENCTTYSYDGPFTSTVSEWGLICAHAPVGAMLQMMFFLGMLAGSLLIGGALSDAIGRKVCAFASSAIMTGAAFGSSFANSAPLFACLEFFLGFGLAGALLTQYTLNMEILGPKWRTLGGNLCEFYWIYGGVLCTLVPYFIREWRTLVMVTSLSGVPLFFAYRLIPRSPRWLVAHGHLDEALQVLMKFGGKNKVRPDPVELRTLLEEVRKCQIAHEEKKKKYTQLDLFRTPKLRKWILLLCYNWFVVSLVNNTLFMFVTSLAGDLYLNAALMGLSTCIMLPITWFTQMRVGRRISNGVLMVLGSACSFMILAAPADKPMITTVLAICGAAFTYGIWTVTYLLISELFPTVLRNTALSTGSTVARLGGIMAPYMAMMGHLPGVTMSLPMGLFGSLALLAAIATYWIPETLFANMHQTIEEVEAAEDYYGMPCCGKPPRHVVEADEHTFPLDTKL